MKILSKYVLYQQAQNNIPWLRLSTRERMFSKPFSAPLLATVKPLNTNPGLVCIIELKLGRALA